MQLKHYDKSVMQSRTNNKM